MGTWLEGLLTKVTSQRGQKQRPRGGTSLDDCPSCLNYCSISCRSHGGSNQLVCNSHPRAEKVGRRQSLGSREFLPKLKSMGHVGEVVHILEKEPERPKEVV